MGSKTPQKAMMMKLTLFVACALVAVTDARVESPSTEVDAFLGSDEGKSHGRAMQTWTYECTDCDAYTYGYEYTTNLDELIALLEALGMGLAIIILLAVGIPITVCCICIIVFIKCVRGGGDSGNDGATQQV